MNVLPTKIPWIYYDHRMYCFLHMKTQICYLIILNNTSVFIFIKLSHVINYNWLFMWRIVNFVSSSISVDKISKFSLNVIISLVDIPCFHYVTVCLFMSKVIIAKTKTSDCGWSRNGTHELWKFPFYIWNFPGLGEKFCNELGPDFSAEL